MRLLAECKLDQSEQSIERQSGQKGRKTNTVSQHQFQQTVPADDANRFKSVKFIGVVIGCNLPDTFE